MIYPYVDLIQQEPGLDGMFRHIERCGRTCYKSEDKITDSSADTFVANLIKNKHYAILEHGTVYLTVSHKTPPINDITTYYSRYKENPYSVVNTDDDFVYVTTNYRVLLENGWLDDLQYICEPTECHVPRITLKFVTNIGVTREGNRHRTFSIAEESTRYCNYCKDKFNNEITYVIPAYFTNKLPAGHYKMTATSFECNNKAIDINSKDNLKLRPYLYLLQCAENMYLKSISLGATPQQAREILPLATKSEVVYTAFPHQWKHFFDLRLFGTTGKPHPNMKEIAELAQGVLEENGLWELIYPDYDYESM